MRLLTWLASGLIGQACAAGSCEPRASGLHRGLPGGKGFALRIQYFGVKGVSFAFLFAGKFPVAMCFFSVTE